MSSYYRFFKTLVGSVIISLFFSLVSYGAVYPKSTNASVLDHLDEVVFILNHLVEAESDPYAPISDEEFARLKNKACWELWFGLQKVRKVTPVDVNAERDLLFISGACRKVPTLSVEEALDLADSFLDDYSK